MRLFIGLPLSSAAAEDTAALSARAQASIPGRYVPKSNYHITLTFLGEVNAQQLEHAKSALDAFAPQFCAPRLTLCGLSHFAKASNAILIRTAKSPDDLSAMRHALIQELNARALPFTDGPFCPHVTLARHCDVSGAELSAFLFSPVSFAASQAVLYLSARDEANILRYTPLHSVFFRDFP